MAISEVDRLSAPDWTRQPPHRRAIGRVRAGTFGPIGLGPDDGTAHRYDVLVVATGARLVPEETAGLLGPAWMDDVFTFYTPEGAAALGAALAAFDHGRLVVNVVDMPIKCPVAPLEFCFLADWYFTERGIREQVQITLVPVGVLAQLAAGTRPPWLRLEHAHRR